MLHRPRATSRHLAVFALLIAGAPLAAAQSNLDTVELRGTRAAEPPRVDVRRTCPDVDEHLTEGLARAIYMSGQAGTIHVRFQLDGQRVSKVETRGGPLDYRAPLRRAVRGMACANDGQPNQQYNFLVVIRPTDEASDAMQDRVAVQELPASLALAR